MARPAAFGDEGPAPVQRDIGGATFQCGVAGAGRAAARRVEVIGIAARVGHQGPELAILQHEGLLPVQLGGDALVVALVVAADGDGVDVEAEGAPPHFLDGDVGKFHLGQDEGNARGDVGGTQALEIIAGQGEARAAGRGLQEDVVDQPVQERDVVEAHIGAVAGGLHVEAGAPVFAERETAGAEDMAIGLRAGRPRQPAIGIVGAAALEPQPAIVPAGAVFHLQHVAAGGGEHRRHRQVLAGRDRDIDRQTNEVADLGGVAGFRRQKPAGIAHRGIGHRKGRHPGHGHALHGNGGALEAHLVLGLVIDHALGLDLPQRRALAGLVADLARGVGGAMGDHRGAVDALGAAGGQPPGLADQGAEARQRAVAQMVGQHHMVGEGDIPARIGDADMAARRYLVVDLVIIHPLGQQGAAVIHDLDMADGRHRLALAVIDDLIGLQQHGRVLGRRSRPARRCALAGRLRAADRLPRHDRRGRSRPRSRQPSPAPSRRRTPAPPGRSAESGRRRPAGQDARHWRASAGFPARMRQQTRL